MTPNENPSDDSGEESLHEIPLSLDAILDILANYRRRTVLEYLMDQPDNIGSLEKVTKHILLNESRKTGSQPSHDAIQASLLHQQLPKLADAGIIEYDIRSQTIRYQENKRLETAYERVRDLELD